MAGIEHRPALGFLKAHIVLYTERLDRALAFAAQAFRTRARKGSSIPYLTHLLQVMVTVAEHGGDEDQMIAALLHDYLEDIPGARREDVAALFGGDVATLVVKLSDSTGQPRPAWEGRKRRYLAGLRGEGPRIKLISAADKLHNARSIARDHALLGDDVWARFTASRAQTLWYYRAALDALGDGWAHPLLEELRRVVVEVHAAAGEEMRPEGDDR
jgi:(p)ppGpp synthase/HD superfamily hydrolase